MNNDNKSAASLRRQETHYRYPPDSTVCGLFLIYVRASSFPVPLSFVNTLVLVKIPAAT